MNIKSQLEKPSLINDLIQAHNQEIKASYDHLVTQHELWQERFRQNAKWEKEEYENYIKVHGGKKYFKLDHLDTIGFKANIIIVISEKNVGKTTALYEDIQRRIVNGEKVLVARVGDAETEALGREMANEESWPIVADRTGNKKQLYARPGIISEEGGEVVGELINGGRCERSGGGGNYAGFTTTYIDEIIPKNPHFAWAKTFDSWSKFLSSVTRNKKERHMVYMFANLAHHNTNILDFYGINKADKLRIFNNSVYGSQYADVLFINIAKIYTGGIGSQSGVLHGSLRTMEELSSNSLLSLNESITTREIFELGDRHAALVIPGDTVKDHTGEDCEYIVIFIKTLTYQQSSNNVFNGNKEIKGGVKAERFESYIVNGGEAFTGDTFAAEEIGIEYDPAIIVHYNNLALLQKSKELFYFDEYSRKVVKYVVEDLLKKEETNAKRGNRPASRRSRRR